MDMDRRTGHTCPLCGRFYMEPPALSRKDDATKICPECGMMEALTTIPGLQEYPAEHAQRTIQRFIKRFAEHGPQVEQCFTSGCCYWFAWILVQRFPGAEIVYGEVDNHFAARIGGRVYDITGDVTDRASASWKPWKSYEEGSSHRAGIVRNCILFSEGGCEPC